MYKIKWISLSGNSGHLPIEYHDKEKAEDDAKNFNKKFPGIMHYVEEIDNV